MLSRLIIIAGLTVGITTFLPTKPATAACSSPSYYNQLFHDSPCLGSEDMNRSWSEPPVLGSSRPNAVNATQLNVTGGMSIAGTIITAPSTTAAGGLIVTPGANPSSPANGTIWTTSTGAFAMINGGIINLGGGGGGGGGGSSPAGATNSLQYNAGSGAFGSIPLTNGQLVVGQTGSAPSAQTMSGDCTISNIGVILCSKTNGSNFGSLALLNTITVATGGTGLASGTSGGVLAYTGATTMASSPLLINHGIVVGGGVGATPSTLTSLGTATTVLHGNASGNPSFGPVNLSTEVTGSLPISAFNGGTNASSTTCFFGDNTWKTCGSGGGGGSLTVTDGTNTVTSTTSLTFNSMVIAGTGGVATATPSAHINTTTSNYTMANLDMGGVRNLNGTNLTLTIPAISSTVFGSGMQSTVCNYNATAVTISSTPTINGYAGTIPGKVTVANCVGLSSNGTTLDAAPFHYSANLIYASTTNQAISGGFRVTPFAIGTVSSGTSTIDCGSGSGQTLTNGGAFTMAAPSNDGMCVVRVTNNGSAGTVTFSGFTQGSTSGDALTTTNGNTFDISITRLGGSKPTYLVHALQ